MHLSAVATTAAQGGREPSTWGTRVAIRAENVEALLAACSAGVDEIKAAGFLKEDEGAGRLKAFVSGQDVKAEKIRVELWRK